MSHTKLIAQNTIVQIIGKIFSTILGLIAIGMMTRYLGTEKFGWYITTITFLQFVGILIDFGLIPVSGQMLAEADDKTKIFKNLFAYRFFTALFFLGLTPFVALLFPYPPEVKTAIAISTVSFFCISLNQIFIGLYQTKLKMYIPTIGELVGRLVLVGGLWLLIFKQASFLPIMLVVALSTISYTFVMFAISKKEMKIGFEFDWSIWRQITKKMWPIAIAVIFNVIYLRGDTIILSFFRPQAEVGIYGAAYRVIDVYSQISALTMGVIMPLLAFYWSQNLKDEFKKYYQLSFDIIMIFAVPILIGTLILATKIMHLVAGNEFIRSGRSLQILALAVFGVYLGSVFGHTAIAINRQKEILWIFISNAIITTIGYLIFIPKFGLYGAAWMTVFSEFYTGIFLFFITRHYTQVKIKIKNSLKIILASLLMGLILISLIKLNVIILVLIGALTYGLFLLAFQVISKNNLKELFLIKKQS